MSATQRFGGWKHLLGSRFEAEQRLVGEMELNWVVNCEHDVELWDHDRLWTICASKTIELPVYFFLNHPTVSAHPIPLKHVVVVHRHFPNLDLTSSCPNSWTNLFKKTVAHDIELFTDRNPLGSSPVGFARSVFGKKDLLHFTCWTWLHKHCL